tara:strand:+ start:936 stop:1361 length:426 start_codon:yes stop_codon:yes gene_type:complete
MTVYCQSCGWSGPACPDCAGDNVSPVKPLGGKPFDAQPLKLFDVWLTRSSSESHVRRIEAVDGMAARDIALADLKNDLMPVNWEVDDGNIQEAYVSSVEQVFSPPEPSSLMHAVWRYEVDNGDTMLGFDAWLTNRVEAMDT